MARRSNGRLLGLPPWPSAAPGRCVDPQILLASLADPRALGLGDCALSAMVAAGGLPLPDGGQRYACPSLACTDTVSAADTLAGADLPPSHMPAPRQALPGRGSRALPGFSRQSSPELDRLP